MAIKLFRKQPYFVRIRLKGNYSFWGALIAYAFFLVFGVAFSFPWQTLHITCQRQQGEAPACVVKNVHWCGLYVRTARAFSVRDITEEARESSDTIVTDLMLKTSRGDIPVYGLASNVDNQAKRRIVKSVQDYLNDDARPSLHLRVPSYNIFGFIGYPILLFVLWTLAAWGMAALWPLATVIDMNRMTCRVRLRPGQVAMTSVPVHNIREINVIMGGEAVRVLYPRLARRLQAVERALAAHNPAAGDLPKEPSPKAVTSAGAAGALEYVLLNGERIVQGAPNIKKEEWQQARDALWEVLKRG